MVSCIAGIKISVFCSSIKSLLQGVCTVHTPLTLLQRMGYHDPPLTSTIATFLAAPAMRPEPLCTGAKEALTISFCPVHRYADDVSVHLDTGIEHFPIYADRQASLHMHEYE